MIARRVSAILGKDLREALRDGRILLLLLLPIALAVFYNATTPDRDELPQTTIVVVDPGRTGVAQQLRRATAESVQVEVLPARDARAARRIVDADDASLAVVAAPAGGPDAPARAEVLLPENATPTAQAVVAAVPQAVAAAADRPPTTDVRIRRLPVSAADREPAQVLETRTILIVISIVTLLGFVALIVVPMQTAEELGTGTFGALRLAATGPEILAAKALSGLIYAAAGTAVTLLVTRVSPANVALFFAAAVALAISLVGFGILIGLISGNANQINTYGGVLFIPIVGLAGAVLFVDSGVLGVLLDVLPFSQGTRLLFDGFAPEQPFGAGIVAWLVLGAWTVLGAVVLARVSTRREL